MDQVLDFLAGCNWWMAVLLPIAMFAWMQERYDHREKVRRQVLANEAGALCAHGKYKWHSCASCAEEFASSARDLVDQADEDLEDLDDEPDEDPAPAGPGLAAAALGAFDVDTSKFRPQPLRVDLPPNEGGEIVLEVDTNASWAGPSELAVQYALGPIHSIHANIPASTHHWEMPIRGQVRYILIPDVRGLDRIRVRINGYVVIDATPAQLLGLKECAGPSSSGFDADQIWKRAITRV